MNQPDVYDADRVQRVHLSHLLNHTASPCLESFSPSFVEPCAYWSHVEKASFFKSLARHSRWKPDLIAEDIGDGKTVADVCSYIALLDQGSARESRKGCKRDTYPIAHELSEEWIAVENDAAGQLCGKEKEWQEAALKDKRARELREVKKSLRRGSEIVRGSGSEGDDVLTTSQNKKRKREASNEENEEWEVRFKARKRELRDLWERENMLSSLDGRYLKTMDKMIQMLGSTEADKYMEGRGQLERPPIPLAEIPLDLSPASRRRLRKRLWTRRKRAMESGLPVSDVPMDMAKLKPGRKAKHKVSAEGVKTKDDPVIQVETNLPGAIDASSHRSTSRGHPGILADVVDEAKDENQESELASKRKPYGWSKLTARQVSGETLRADGIDLFHLEKFVSIMSLLGHVHALSNRADTVDELDGSSDGPSTLSYPLIRLLRACVTRFVTCLMAYAILHKDVETRQKRRIRGLFRADGVGEIRAENIREALLHMDRDTTTKHFFTRLKRTVRKAAGSEPHGTDDLDELGSSDDGSNTGETEDDTPSYTDSLSIRFNRVFQKAFPLPCGDPQSASPLYWNPNILSALGGSKARDSLLPDEIDEAGLWKELRAEEKIEQADRKADHIHERELWMEIGVTREEHLDPVTNTLSQPEGPEASWHLNTEAGNSLRFRQPWGTVKSRVYIDSDEDL